ncbi:MAG: DNA repair protein RadC [Stagnimonas sp.]|nr:DNA repair protein RadC [Stagnimonas sp.]
MSIRDWPEGERPREKLLAQGAAGLSDAELLAIFLRTGIPGLSAVDLARQLLSRFGGLRGLLGAERAAFCAERGLGTAKYAQLQAVLELARRHLGETLAERDLLREPALVRRYLASRLRDGDRERFHGLFLDSQNRLLASEVLAEGTLSEASVYPREVVKAALRLGAAAVIFAHNHPSGAPEPSEADRRLTERLRQALATVEVRVLDHFVVGEGPPLSFAERGLL